MTMESVDGSMAEILLPEKQEFERRVDAVSQRISSISESNTMAKLLHSNFTNWLNSSAVSPVKLTQDLDEDKNGMISGDEFATLLGKMTGENPLNGWLRWSFRSLKPIRRRAYPLRTGWPSSLRVDLKCPIRSLLRR